MFFIIGMLLKRRNLLFGVFCGLFLPQVQSRCSDNTSDWFGRIYYDQYKGLSEVESCTWHIKGPENTRSALILKLVAFPVWSRTNSSRNYLRLPEGSQVSADNVRSHLFQCKRYVKADDPDPCPSSFLDHYCRGPTLTPQQWPPVLTSYSSQSFSSFYALGFTISYVYVKCPSSHVTSTPTLGYFEATSSIRNNRSAGFNLTGQSTTYDVNRNPIFHNTTNQERSKENDDSTLLIVVGGVAALLIVLFLILVIVLALKLRRQKIANLYEVAYTKNLEPSYCYAMEAQKTSEASNIYATVATLKDRVPEIPPRRPSVYLTMRVQDSGSEKSYQKMRNDSTATESLVAKESIRRMAGSRAPSERERKLSRNCSQH